VITRVNLRKVETGLEQVSDVAEVSADAPEVEKLVNAIILGALQQKATSWF